MKKNVGMNKGGKESKKRHPDGTIFSDYSRDSPQLAEMTSLLLPF
jgi:hypothetical protein